MYRGRLQRRRRWAAACLAVLVLALPHACGSGSAASPTCRLAGALRGGAPAAVMRAKSVPLVGTLRGGQGVGEGEEEDSAAQREAALLAEMGLGYVPDDDARPLRRHARPLRDAEGREFAPAVRTVSGELCSADDLSLPTEEEPDHGEEEPGHFAMDPFADPAYVDVQQSPLGDPALRSLVRIKYYDLACGATWNTFSSVLCIASFYSKYARTLTFESWHTQEHLARLSRPGAHLGHLAGTSRESLCIVTLYSNYILGR